MIKIRRTVKEDYTDRPWRAEIDIAGTRATLAVPDANQNTVHAFGADPELAVAECFKQIGRRAYMSVLEPAKTEESVK